MPRSANKKDLEGGTDHPDRDEQFRHINMMGLRMQLKQQPIMSIDAKKTEKIGNMKNAGKEWMPPGEDIKVDVYDFGKTDPNKKGRIMKAIPYGVYDVLKKQGFVNVGIDHNTAEFAVASLTTWWDTKGKQEYPEADEILLFCDSGKSLGAKNKLWKYCLQQFANRTGLAVHVCHAVARVRASGMPLSMRCSASSPSTGGPHRSPRMRSSWNSSGIPRPRRG
jgi:hypothetical protein